MTTKSLVRWAAFGCIKGPSGAGKSEIPAETKIASEAITHALSDKMLAVPMYQRSHAWGDGHVRAFLQDVSTAIDKGEAEYFMGSIPVPRRKE